MIDEIETVLGSDFPRLMEALPRPDFVSAAPTQDVAAPLIYDAPSRGGGGGGSSAADPSDVNPWGDDDVTSGAGDEGWALQEYVAQYKSKFDAVQSNGLVSGGAAKGVLTATGLPSATLRKIWDLSDIDKDGQLDLQEFVVALFIANYIKEGGSIPDRLDDAMVPPGKTLR